MNLVWSVTGHSIVINVEMDVIYVMGLINVLVKSLNASTVSELSRAEIALKHINRIGFVKK